MFFKKDDFKDMANAMGTAGTLGLHFVTAIGVGVAIGWWLDDAMEWHPWGKLVGIAVGVAAAYRMVWQDASKIAKSQDKDDYSGGGDDDNENEEKK